jgi:LppX_LprAFG lipoprotein
VGRFASAFAFLFVLVVVLGSAGCGDRFDDLGGSSPPSQSAFASDALVALRDVGSAHVVLDAQGGSISGTNAQLGMHFEGDVSTSALAGDVQVTFPGGTLGARVLVDEHDLYVRFMSQWYHASGGVSDALKDASEENGELLLELATPAGLGNLFTQLFEGEIAAGPDIGGTATWEFDGRLRAETFATLVEKYGAIDLTDNDRALFDKVAATSHIVVDVGQDDDLPRKLELTLSPPKDLHFDSEELESSDGALSLTVELSDFGQEVSFSPPKDPRPLDDLFGQLFGVVG